MEFASNLISMLLQQHIKFSLLDFFFFFLSKKEEISSKYMKNQNIYYRIPWNNSNYVVEVDT